MADYVLHELSDASLAEFIDIFERNYGKRFTLEEAREAAGNLIGYVSALAKIAERQKASAPATGGGASSQALEG